MLELANKQVLVVGLGGRGRAACRLLQARGAHVVGVDGADTVRLRENTAPLRVEGVEVRLGTSVIPERPFDLAVMTPAVPPSSPLFKEVVARKLPMIGELELGYRLAKCLTLAVTGTNGKATAAELIERVLRADHRRTLAAGHRARPVCGVVDETRDLDFLLLQIKAQQLELMEFLRPAVAVLLNADSDHLDRYASVDEYLRTLGKIFVNQQPFDWAIIQHEALARLQALRG